MKARLVLIPDEHGGELEGYPVIVAEVERVTVQHGQHELQLDATYVESMTRGPAQSRLDRPAVGWPLIVYVRREGDGETASPKG